MPGNRNCKRIGDFRELFASAGMEKYRLTQARPPARISGSKIRNSAHCKASWKCLTCIFSALPRIPEPSSQPNRPIHEKHSSHFEEPTDRRVTGLFDPRCRTLVSGTEIQGHNLFCVHFEPVYLGYGQSEGGVRSLYLFLGRSF